MKTLKFSSLLILLSVLFFACQKEYSVEIKPTPAGSWQFNDSTKLYTGNIDTAYIETSGTTKTMNLIGRSADGSQNFILHLTAIDSFSVGTSYKASLSQSDFEYYGKSKNIYQADQSVSGEFTVTLTALGNNNVTGTFLGAAEDSTLSIKQLTLGKFTSRINLAGSGTGGGTGTGVATLGVTAGTCTSYSFSGAYTQGISLNPTSNTVSVQVNVTAIGTYTVSTNTVNGVTFSKNGVFTTTGVQSIILAGSGLPAASGVKDFIVTLGSSTCNFSITFGTGTPPAIGTLGGAPGSCTSVTPAGTYTQGIALTSGNTLTVQANVTSVGPYSITTNSVNGVSFTGTGTFTALGLQNVVLIGTGTPIASGSQNFIITFGANSCNYSITFIAGTPTTLSNDYFPMTTGSYWAYGNVTQDSILIQSTSGRKTFGSQTYNIFLYNNIPASGSPDSLYYRQAGGLYYESFDINAFLQVSGAPNQVEYIFLDTTGVTSWQSSNFTVIESGVTYTIYVKMTLTKVTTPVTVGIVTASNILKVNYDYYASALGSAAIIFYKEVRWFAKGIGVVYNSFDDLSGSPDNYNIGRYKVN